MRLGALLGPVDPANANSLAEQARELEGEGFDSLWSAQATGRGFMMSDPFIELTAAVVATDKVELGTGILQLSLYEPVDVALKAFSLMQVAGGRLLLGVGAGSTEVDHLIHRSDFDARFNTFNEKLALLRGWFSDGEQEGRSISPWSGVAGGPKLGYGTWGKGVARAAKEFDFWIASGTHRNADDLEKTIPGYREAGGKRAIVSTILITGETDLSELEDTLARYAGMGFDDAVVMFMPGAPDPSSIRKLVN
jgi:alkanesulfonate monooxygenase SsuD/methylene tetrahydromethanopterin reductase-like flavin-dependent oxidoreductase (luciferase family)